VKAVSSTSSFGGLRPQAFRPGALFLKFPLKISILEGFPECRLVLLAGPPNVDEWCS